MDLNFFPADSSTMRTQKQKSCWPRWLMTTQSQRSQVWLQGTRNPTAQEAHKTAAETRGRPQAQLRLWDQGRETLPGLTGDSDTDDTVLTHLQDWWVTVTTVTHHQDSNRTDRRQWHWWHTTRTDGWQWHRLHCIDTPPGLMADSDTDDIVLTHHRDWRVTVTLMMLYWHTTRTDGWQWHQWHTTRMTVILMTLYWHTTRTDRWQWHWWYCIDTPPGLTGDSDTNDTVLTHHLCTPLKVYNPSNNCDLTPHLNSSFYWHCWCVNSGWKRDMADFEFKVTILILWWFVPLVPVDLLFSGSCCTIYKYIYWRGHRVGCLLSHLASWQNGWQVMKTLSCQTFEIQAVTAEVKMSLFWRQIDLNEPRREETW